MLRSSSTAVVGAARRESEHGASRMREAVDSLNGWRPPLTSSITSKSAPLLPVRRLAPVSSPATGSSSASAAVRSKRFRPISLAPLEAMPAAPAFAPASPAEPAKPENPGSRRSGARPYATKVSPERPSPSFAAPPRQTKLDVRAEYFECAAPGYYDRSLLNAPWSLGGSVAKESTRLSSSFLARGRADMPSVDAAGTSDLPPIEELPADDAAEGLAGLVMDAEVMAQANRNKMRRQQREITAMQVEKRKARAAASVSNKSLHNDVYASMSPAMMKVHDASFEKRLERSTVVNATDRAIDLLVQKSRRSEVPLSVHDFGSSNAGVLYPNAPALNGLTPAEKVSTLSFSYTAYSAK